MRVPYIHLRVGAHAHVCRVTKKEMFVTSIQLLMKLIPRTAQFLSFCCGAEVENHAKRAPHARSQVADGGYSFQT
jgi:hypothetical protein